MRQITSEELETLGDKDLLLPGEVAYLMRVDPKTVGRWAKEGRIQFVKTVGNHRRYRAGDVKTMMGM